MQNSSPSLAPGSRFPDVELTDHSGNRRTLSELIAGDPAVLQFYRGWWCPKEQAFLRRLVAFQDEVEVAYARIISVSVDAPEVAAAFRAGLGARTGSSIPTARPAGSRSSVRRSASGVGLRRGRRGGI